MSFCILSLPSGFNINPYPVNVDNMAGLLPMLANGGWDLIQRLEGETHLQKSLQIHL